MERLFILCSPRKIYFKSSVPAIQTKEGRDPCLSKRQNLFFLNLRRFPLSLKNTIRLFSIIRGIFGELNFNCDFIFTNNQISVNRKEVNDMIYTLRLS